LLSLPRSSWLVILTEASSKLNLTLNLAREDHRTKDSDRAR
jgi:hypothetical protein